MHYIVIIGIVGISLGIALVLIVVVLGSMKDLKREDKLDWKFLDYFSVGYLVHLYRKFIKRV